MSKISVKAMEQEFVNFVFSRHPDTKINNISDSKASWERCAIGAFYKQKFGPVCLPKNQRSGYNKNYTKDFIKFLETYVHNFKSYKFLDSIFTAPERYRQLQKYYISLKVFDIPAKNV